MRQRLGPVAGLLALAAAAPVQAADVSAELGLVSDYRFRGLSLSDGKPALQLDIMLEHDNGAYAELWASSIGEAGSHPMLELEAAAGYSLDVTKHVSLDVAGTYYIYPGDPDANYGELAATLEFAHGASTLALGAAFAPAQQGTRSAFGEAEQNLYLSATASRELTNAPVILSLSLGYERGAFDETSDGGKWDWSAGADLALDHARIGLSYCGSNAGDDALVAALHLML